MATRTTACQGKHGISDADMNKILENGERYNTADPNVGYSKAAEDLIPTYKSLISAIQKAMVDKAKVEAPTTTPAPVTEGTTSVMRKSSWGKPGTVSISGQEGYIGPVTEVTDMDAFMAENPGFVIAKDRLEAAGLGHLLDSMDKVFIAEDSESFDAGGAVYWNPDTNDLELYLDRKQLDNQGGLAFTVQHEMGHISDGAFGSEGSGKYSSTVPKHVIDIAMAESMQDTTLGALLEYPMTQDSESSMREELVAQLFAIAANPVNISKLPPVLAHYIQGVIRDAKSTSKATIAAARFRAAKETKPSRTRRSSQEQQNAKGQLQENVQQSKGKVVPERLSTVVEAAARRVGGASAAIVAGDVTGTVKRMALSLMSLHDIVDKFKATVPAIGDWYRGMQAVAATRRQYQQDAEKIAGASEKLATGTERLNEFLSRSTYDQKWGYVPSWDQTVVPDPVMEARYRALTPAERGVVQAVFTHGENMRQARQKMLDSLGLTGVLKMTGALKGPYAPLKRFGDYVAVLKSQELRDAETANDTKKIETLKQDEKHYSVSMFDTDGAAKQYAYENDAANGGKYAFSDSFIKSSKPEEGKSLPTAVLDKVLAAMKLDANLDPTAKANITKLVQDMALQYMDDQHARTSGQQRKNRSGYDKDMMRSFVSHANAEAAFLANIKHGGDINTAFIEMQRQAKDQTTGHRIHQDAVNTLAQHYADSLNTKETPWQDRAMAMTSAWQLATSLGYHVTNFMQGVMVTVPKLAADFNDYSGAWKHLKDGYMLMKSAGIGNSFDIAKVQNPGLRAALQSAMDMGVLDVGMAEDMAHFNTTKTGIGSIDATSKAAQSALHKLRQVSRAVEVMNRVASATAAYNMSIAKGKTPAQASEYATRILQSTQGDFSRVGSPLILKKLPKFITQYKKYQFMMAALYAKAYTQAFHGSTPEEKAIGRRMLAYKLGHTGIAAGVLGLPLMNMVQLVMGAMGGDDEPYDLERDLRKAIGDETTADLLLHGPLAYAGLDMSSKLGDDNIFSIMPYGKFDVSSKAKMLETAGGLLGPAVSQAGRFADGIGMMQKGEYEKATEKFMPKGVENAMKAFRIANEGYSLKNGDLMVKPEDINGMALTLDALGMPSTALKKMDWLRGQQYEIGQFYIQRSKDIEQQYVMASRDGDSEKLAKLREDWMSLQGGKDNLRYLFNDSHEALKKQPLSTLLKAPQNSGKREQKLQKSVAIAG